MLSKIGKTPAGKGYSARCTSSAKEPFDRQFRIDRLAHQLDRVKQLCQSFERKKLALDRDNYRRCDAERALIVIGPRAGGESIMI